MWQACPFRGSHDHVAESRVMWGWSEAPLESPRGSHHAGAFSHSSGRSFAYAWRHPAQPSESSSRVFHPKPLKPASPQEEGITSGGGRGVPLDLGCPPTRPCWCADLCPFLPLLELLLPPPTSGSPRWTVHSAGLRPIQLRRARPSFKVQRASHPHHSC